MGDFYTNLRNVFFEGQHTIVSSHRPCKEIRHLRQSLRAISDYLDMSGCYSSGHDFYASAKIEANKISKQACFIGFGEGVFVIGRLNDLTGQLENKAKIIYAIYFGKTADNHCAQFVALPKGSKAYIGLGRETDRYYVNITCKHPWQQLSYEDNCVYDCKGKKLKSPHPEIVRKATDIILPEISFDNCKQDEIQQLHRASEENFSKRQFIFIRGQLRLQ